jgi:peptidoglycan/LPS O-acetylase OafA/YrhL
VLSHLWTSLTLWAGPYAVFSFWSLSGYLMALVLDRTYGFSGAGVRRYLTNRALRIYPPYWVALALAVPLIASFPEVTRSFSRMRVPADAVTWVQNLLIFTTHLDRRASSGPIQVIWSIDIELCFYLLMPLLVRKRGTVLIWCSASVAWTAWLVATGQPFQLRYSNLAAASLPYSAGAVCYAFREPLTRLFRAGWHRVASLALFAANAAYPPLPPQWSLYLSLAATLYVVVAWGQVKTSQMPRRFVRLDAVLGDLSYPVFLCHMPVALAVLVLGLAQGRGPALFFLAVPAVNGFAWLIHRGVEAQMERFRNRVRGHPRPET